MDEKKRESAFSFFRKNGWLLLMLAAGVLLLLLPARPSEKEDDSPAPLTEAEQRLAGALARTEGVGQVYVLLSEKTGREEGYVGAVVVCAGAGDPQVQLRVVETVSAFTGLGSNKIVVQKMIS